MVPDAWGLGKGLGMGLGGVGQGKTLTSAFEGAAAFNNLVSARAPTAAFASHGALNRALEALQLRSRHTTQGS